MGRGQRVRSGHESIWELIGNGLDQKSTRRIKMKKVLAGIALVTCVVLGSVFAVQAASLDDAKAMAEKAMAYMKANGKDKAIAEYNNPKGQFVKGDLYIIAQGFNGVMLANGGNPKLVGQNHLEVKDPNGKLFVQEMVQVAKTKGTGWVEYSWTNPTTKKVQAKKTWVMRVEGADFYIGCGVFQ
jgi:cytochrome c